MRVRTIEEIQAGKEKDYYDVLRLHKEVSCCVLLLRVFCANEIDSRTSVNVQ